MELRRPNYEGAFVVAWLCKVLAVVAAITGMIVVVWVGSDNGLAAALLALVIALVPVCILLTCGYALDLLLSMSAASPVPRRARSRSDFVDAWRRAGDRRDEG